MKLSKESKIRVLENFYALDYIFFGKPLKESKTCCPAVSEEYITTKGALMAVFVEMLKEIEHSPKPLEEGNKLTKENLFKYARLSASHVRENCEKILSSDKGRNFVKESLKEDLKGKDKVKLTSEVKNKIQETAYKISVDNLLLARSLQESKNVKKLNELEGQLLEDSYKILRDGLVECALVILNNDDE